jgi:hypothetical protein
MELFSDSGLAESTKRGYIRRLEILNKDRPIESLKFLKKVDKINEFLNNKFENIATRKTYYTAICCCLNGRTGFENAYETYKKIMTEISQQQKEQPKLSAKKEENFLSKEEINDIFQNLLHEVKSFSEYERLNETEYKKLLSLVVLSLYVLQSPRRSKDYYLMKVIKKEKRLKDSSNDFNYLVLKEKKFIFNQYKTVKCYEQQVENISQPLFDIIEFYLQHKPKSDFFLVNYKGKEFDVNTITLILNKIFGKNISVSMLRLFNMSGLFSDRLKESDKLMHDIDEEAKRMGTSRDMALNVYIK